MLDAGLIWIGPSPESIEKLGDKIEARKIAASVGAPLVHGTAQPLNNAQEALEFAQTYGLPMAIKAAFGGGGRGLKVAWQLEEVEALYESAVREAITAFGRGECFVEQYLDKPRHLEAQIIADQHGHVVVVGTRDCSLQRRNQNWWRRHLHRLSMNIYINKFLAHRPIFAELRNMWVRERSNIY